MSKEKEKKEDDLSLDSLPPHISDKLDQLCKEALVHRETVQTVLSIQKAIEFIERTKLVLTKKKEKSEFGKVVDNLRKQILPIKVVSGHLEVVKKRNGEFVVLRRLMDLIIHHTSVSGTNQLQAESLLRFTLLFCIIDNPHIKSVQASYHLMQVFIARNIEQYTQLKETHKKLTMRGAGSDSGLRKQLKTWLVDEERLIKIYKELSTPVKLSGAGELLVEEFTDDDRQLILEHRHVLESQCPSKVKNARKKFYFIFGNMTTISPLIEHVRQYTINILGGKEQLQSLQDLSLLCCIVRTFVQEISRLQQYMHISPKIAQKQILTMLNHANPYIFSGYGKVSDLPKGYFELILLENIGYYLTYYVLLVGGIFKNPQIKSPQVQTLINGTIDKLSSDKANTKIRDMLQQQFELTMENF